jgi:phosphate transport system substrate-binding protein
VRRTSLPRAATLGAVVLTVALGLSACGASNEDDPGTSGDNTDGPTLSGDLNGAGSSAQEAAIGAWATGFQTAHSGVTVNYDPAGSSGGREQFIAGGVQFAGTDSYLSDDELASAQDTCGGPAIEYPVYVSPIAIIYNLEGVDSLQLSPETLGAIFSGDITTWDDDAIAADNPDADLPGDTITPVHRSDGSGTTANFTDYLSKASGGSWSYEPDDEWPVKGSAGGEAADGTSGVVAAVQGGKGTIGYADESQAGDLGQAAIKVGDSFNTPSAEGAATVLSESTQVSGRDAATDFAIDVARTSTTEGAYPIVLVSYQVVCSTYADQSTVDNVKAFGSYVISEEGQNAAASAAGSAPIPDNLRTKAQAAIDTIAVK